VSRIQEYFALFDWDPVFNRSFTVYSILFRYTLPVLGNSWTHGTACIHRTTWLSCVFVVFGVSCTAACFGLFLGTVDNHGNMEITETVIFVKCHECLDFAKMPQFYVFTRIFCF